MSVINQIKAEIERLKDEFISNHPKDCSLKLIKSYAGYAYLDKVLSFLDTLEEKSEKPINLEGFSKEFDEYFLPKNREQKGRWGFADIFSLARHFYELGRTAK